MNEISQKWSMSISIEALDHVHDKSKHYFHGSKLMKENRKKIKWTPNFISRFLANYLTISHETRFVAISILGSILIMAWFGKTSKSKTDQKWWAVKIQMLFGLYVFKQMKILLPQVEWWRKLSSWMLGNHSNQICHGWMLGMSVEYTSFQLWNGNENMSTMMLGWWINNGLLECFGDFGQKNAMCENASREKMRVSVVFAAARVPFGQKNVLYTSV